jgi:cysteine-rich repeat protein
MVLGGGVAIRAGACIIIQIFLISLLLPGHAEAMHNPAAAYCEGLGYGYDIVTEGNGQKGVCTMPDDTKCNQWDFLKGKCGKQHSYCVKNGFGIRESENGAVCLLPNGKERPVSSITGINEPSPKYSAPKEKPKDLKDVLLSLGPPQSPPLSDTSSGLDWRNMTYNNVTGDWLTSVKNQGGCGSCWAFGAVGTMEARYNIVNSNPRLDPDISEEYLVSDCHPVFYIWDFRWVQNCCGGWDDVALGFIRDNGVCDESCFPYSDASGCSCGGSSVCSTNCAYDDNLNNNDCSNSICSNRSSDWGSRLWTISGYTGSASLTDNQTKQYLMDHGPLSVNIDISTISYSGGIGSCTEDGTDHCVVLVGYNDTGGYWILKNSWGTGYQDNGYFRVAYGECNVTDYVTYVNSVNPPDFRPSLVLHSPADGMLTSDSQPSFNFTVINRNASTSVCDLLVNGTILNSTTASNATPAVMTASLQDGSYYWNITCWETGFGIANDSARTMTRDSSPPFFYGHQRLPYLPNEDQGVQVSVSVNDLVSGVDTVMLEWNGTKNYTVPAAGPAYPLNITAGNYSAHENVTYLWYANDTAGLLNMSQQQEFIVDNQLPEATGVNLTSDDPGNRTAGNLTAVWGFADSDSGDSWAGNWTLWYLNGSLQGQLENATWIGSGNTSKDDTWMSSVGVHDGYNWSGWMNSSGFTILNTPPSAPTPSAPANDTNVSAANVTFSFSATDDDSDALAYTIYIDGAPNMSVSSNSTEINFTDGYYSWSLIANDGQSNSSSGPVWHFRVDTAGPSVSSASVLPNTVTPGENTSVSANVSDTLTGVSSVWYNMSNSTWSSSGAMPLQSGSAYNGSINTSAMEDGSYNVTVYANDSLGNTRGVPAGALVISQLSTVNISITDGSGNLTNTTKVTLLYSGTSIPFNQSTDNVSGFWTSAAGGIWDLLMEVSSFNITFLELNTSGNITSNVTIDTNLTGLSGPSGVLAILNAIAASTGFNFTGVQIVIPFNVSLFISSSRATVYKCPTWNFTSQACPGGWINVTGNSTINLTSGAAMVNDTSLSAFIIAEGFWCGDGIVDSGEQCDDGNTASGDGCSSSCQTEAPPQPPSGGGTGSPSGAGGAAPAAPPENATESATLCANGSMRCVGDDLQICKDDGSAWEVLEACLHGCDPAGASCMPAPPAVCTPGEKRCMNLTVQQCSAEGYEWENAEECGLFCENGMCLEEAPDMAYLIPWAAGAALAIAIIGAAFLMGRKRHRKPSHRKRPVPSVVMHVPPLKERPKAPKPAPEPGPPPKPKPRPEDLHHPVHATVRDIQLNPVRFLEKPVRISGSIHFSHRHGPNEKRRWHMFKDETGHIPAADHMVFSGKGEIIAVVEETKTHQLYLRIVEFRKH